ncbi:MAG: hypothetical protein F6K40_28490 [Okeania sp. SIO3I5]|uniref:hypothetical protein n=1 Tax=Okeania sp. SIO3I5 TaxID=2607805 RepID=UPI0013BA3EEC|nr:hypothetical protein [Okeania sp. SIO3I5]NEQ39967.1 hypothetical protein [Okeania sp. SIO3I5]
MQILSSIHLSQNLTIHLLWRGASGNVLTIALYAIEEKFHYSSPLAGASGNVLTIALYAIEEKFHYSSPLAGCFRKCIDYCSMRKTDN